MNKLLALESSMQENDSSRTGTGPSKEIHCKRIYFKTDEAEDFDCHHFVGVNEDPLHLLQSTIEVTQEEFEGKESLFLSMEQPDLPDREQRAESRPPSPFQGPLYQRDHSSSAHHESRSNKRDREEDKPAETDEASAKKPSVSTSEENIVKWHLQKTLLGQAALNAARKKKELNPATRVKICHEIIIAELGEDANKCISGKRFEFLAESICELFPNELKGMYFTPRVPACGKVRAIQPKGILYDKYHNVLKYLRQNGLRSSIRSSGERSDDVSEEDASEPSTSVAADIEWLEKNSTESQSLVDQKWKSTAAYRLNILRNAVDKTAKSKLGKKEIGSYFTRFTCLFQNWGLNLLLEDFEFLYGGKYSPLIENWPLVASKLLALAKKNKDDLETGKIVRCLHLIPTFFRQPLLMSSSGPKTTKRKTWKPNVSESTETFMLHIKSVSDLHPELSRIRSKCDEVQKPLQPIPIVIGPTEDEIVDCYIVINNMCYRVESPLVAFDTCFKLYHALHSHYPFQSSYAWLFVQRAMYNIKTEWDIDIPAVISKEHAYRNMSI